MSGCSISLRRRFSISGVLLMTLFLWLFLRSPTDKDVISKSFLLGLTAQESIVGSWGKVKQVGLVPAAASLLPGSSKVLLWAADRGDVFDSPIHADSERTITSSYDYVTEQVSQPILSNTWHNMFCPGLSLSGQGRPLVTGGKSSTKMSWYDVDKPGWVAGQELTVGRGYHSQCTLSNGDIFALGGSWSGDMESKKNGEVYHHGKWIALSQCPVDGIMTNDRRGRFAADNHAWLFAWRNASVFHAGPSRSMNWFTAEADGDHATAGLRGEDLDAMNGNAVMYDAVEGKILTLGGSQHYSDCLSTSNANIITLDHAFTQPRVEQIAGMTFARAFSNSVILPGGEVFINGGQTWPHQWTDQNSSLQPEIWNSQTRVFTVLNNSPVPRNYHSFALLLPDATVLTGGGGLCWETCDEPSASHPDIQVFYPPNLHARDGSRLDDHQRPRIMTVSRDRLPAGSVVEIECSGRIASAEMIRMSSATHSINTDQRRIPLTIRALGMQRFEFVLPTDYGILIPGYWMLFVLDDKGVPSVSAHIQVVL